MQIRRSSPARSGSPSSARRTTSSAAGWPPATPRSASRSPTSSRRAAAARAGRGRRPPGAALLLSLGFRPTWLAPDGSGGWRRSTSLAMADAAEEVAGLAPGTIRLKWPNDLVVETATADVRKLAGVLGETDGLGTRRSAGRRRHRDQRRLAGGRRSRPSSPATMTSLREAAGGRRSTRAAAARRLPRPPRGPDRAAPRAGEFDGAGWADRQLTTGRLVGSSAMTAATRSSRALGVDPAAGALVVADRRRRRQRARRRQRRDPPRSASTRRRVTRWPGRCLEG